MPKINRPPQDGFIGSVKSHNNRLSYLERSVATSTPGARVTGATNSVANGGTAGTVNFTTVTYAFSPMTASGAQITAPVTGVYSAKFYLEFGAIASGQANFYIQNVTQSTNEQLGYATTNERSFFASDDIQANAGDVLQIGLNNSTGGSITFTANSFFTLTFVSSGSSAVAAGLQGPQGPQGATGAQGPQGIPGTGNITAGKNYIINGGFDFFQRLTSQGASSLSISANTLTYVADRWTVYTTAASTFSVALSAANSGSANGPSLTSGIAVSNVSGSTATAYIATPIENFNAAELANQKVTVSLWASDPSGFYSSFTATVKLWYRTTSSNSAHNGIGGSGNGSATAITLGTFTVPITSTEFTFTSASALPSSLYDLTLEISAPVPAINTIVIGAVKLESGTTATPWCRTGVTISEELALCQRYAYAITANLGAAQTVGMGFATSTTSVRMVYPLPVKMFAVPTLYGSSLTNTRLWNGSTTLGTASAVSLGFASTTAVTLTFTTTGATAGNTYFQDFTSALSTSYYMLTAELT